MTISKHLLNLLIFFAVIILVNAGAFQPKPTVMFEFLGSQPAPDGQRHAVTYRDYAHSYPLGTLDFSTLTGTWIIRTMRPYSSDDTQKETSIPVLLSRGVLGHPLPQWIGTRLLVKIPPNLIVETDIEACMLKFYEWRGQATPPLRLCINPAYVDIARER
jgi:hypothetical protein